MRARIRSRVAPNTGGGHDSSARAGWRGGFTLLELLIVVAIISLLLSILLPALGTARRQARAAVCLTNQRTIAQALRLYAQENKGLLPGVDGQDPHQAWWYKVSACLDERVPPNVFECRQERMPQVLFCPIRRPPFPKLYMPGSQMEITNYFLNGVEKERGMSFGVNLCLGLCGGEGRIADAVSPAECMLVGDSVNFNKIADLDHPSAVQRFTEKDADLAAARLRYHHRATAGFVHAGKINIAYADGHAAALAGKRVFDDYSTDPAQWPGPMRENPDLFYPQLSLPPAIEKPRFWGPPYDRYDQQP